MEKAKKKGVRYYKLRSGEIVDLNPPPLMRFFACFSASKSWEPSFDGTETVDLTEAYVSLESHANASEEARRIVGRDEHVELGVPKGSTILHG